MAWNSPVGVPSRLWLYNSAAYLMFQKNMFIEQNPGDAALCWVHGPVLVARPSPRLLWSFPGGLTNCDSFFLKSDKSRLPSEPISFDFIIGLRCARRTKASAAPSIQLGILYFINYFHLLPTSLDFHSPGSSKYLERWSKVKTWTFPWLWGLKVKLQE